MMAGLPKSVRVGPHVIAITDLPAEEAAQSYGQFSEGSLEIELASTYAAGSLAVDTVLHEIFHAIWFVASLKGETSEERIVSSFGTFFAQVMRDNPKLIAWLQETVKK